MTVIMLIILISIIYSSKYNGDTDFSNYLSFECTNVIKGVFLILVFLSHFTLYGFEWSTEWYDIGGLWIRSHMGQLIVCMFLFYSGYGIMESFKTKKRNIY